MLPTIRKILYTSDLGDSAARVFAFAVALAKQHGASITFVHAMEPLGPTAQTLVRNILPREEMQQLQSQGLAQVREEIKNRIHNFCQAELGPKASEDQLVAEIRIVDGHPAEVIAEQAQELEADLIVMGTHGRAGLQRALLGSVAQKVVSRADRPVLLVPIPEDVKWRTAGRGEDEIVPKVVLKSQVAAAPDLLWHAIREFGAPDRWNPQVHAVQSEGDSIGSTRKVEVEGVGVFVERLERRNDNERSYSYIIVDSPLPISKAAVEVRVMDNGDGTATVEWASSFESEHLSEFQAVKTFQQLYQSALDNLGRHVGRQSAS